MKQLATIQAALHAPKDKQNKFGGYSYRSAEGILEAVKPLLEKNGCTLTLSDAIQQHGDRFYVAATATITNAEGQSVSTTALAREEAVKKGMDAAQITGSASSYARKFALNGLFAIDDNKDPDALTALNNSPKPSPELLAIIAAAPDKATLSAIYKSHTELNDDPTFKNALTARKQQLGL